MDTLFEEGEYPSLIQQLQHFISWPKRLELERRLAAFRKVRSYKLKSPYLVSLTELNTIEEIEKRQARFTERLARSMIVRNKLELILSEQRWINRTFFDAVYAHLKLTTTMLLRNGAGDNELLPDQATVNDAFVDCIRKGYLSKAQLLLGGPDGAAAGLVTADQQAFDRAFELALQHPHSDATEWLLSGRCGFYPTQSLIDERYVQHARMVSPTAPRPDAGDFDDRLAAVVRAEIHRQFAAQIGEVRAGQVLGFGRGFGGGRQTRVARERAQAYLRHHEQAEVLKPRASPEAQQQIQRENERARARQRAMNQLRMPTNDIHAFAHTAVEEGGREGLGVGGDEDEADFEMDDDQDEDEDELDGVDGGVGVRRGGVGGSLGLGGDMRRDDDGVAVEPEHGGGDNDDDGDDEGGDDNEGGGGQGVGGLVNRWEPRRQLNRARAGAVGRAVGQGGQGGRRLDQGAGAGAAAGVAAGRRNRGLGDADPRTTRLTIYDAVVQNLEQRVGVQNILAPGQVTRIMAELIEEHFPTGAAQTRTLRYVSQDMGDANMRVLGLALQFLRLYHPGATGMWIQGFIGESVAVNSCHAGAMERIITGLRGLDDPELQHIFRRAEGPNLARIFLSGTFNIYQGSGDERGAANARHNATHLATELVRRFITATSTEDEVREALGQYAAEGVASYGVEITTIMRGNIDAVVQTVLDGYEDCLLPYVREQLEQQQGDQPEQSAMQQGGGPDGMETGAEESKEV